MKTDRNRPVVLASFMLPYRSQRLALALALLSALLPALLVGCTTTTGLPPATTKPTATLLPGKVIRHDLLTHDPDAARRFYSALLGWTFKAVSSDSDTGKLMSNRGRPIGSLIDTDSIVGGNNVSRWVPVLSVTDVDRAVQLTESDRGIVYQGPVDLDGRGRIAVIADPLGAVVTLVSSVENDPKDQPSRAGDWIWDELWTNYPQQASAFYLALIANYGIRIRRNGAAEAHRLLTSQGSPRAGILAKPVGRIPHTWLGYIRVTDTEDLAKRVPGLGGKVVLAPRRNPSGSTIAMFTDPTGAGFLVQSWPTESP